jgi:hypothetical protein
MGFCAFRMSLRHALQLMPEDHSGHSEALFVFAHRTPESCQDYGMQDFTPVLRRIGQLCASLESDAELRDDIERAGFSNDGWADLAEAIRTGSPDAVAALLDAVENAAAKAGLDGVTYPTRDFHPLPDSSPGFRTVSGWRCPHPRRCGRVHLAANPGDIRRCAVTGDTLTWISADSG